MMGVVIGAFWICWTPFLFMFLLFPLRLLKIKNKSKKSILYLKNRFMEFLTVPFLPIAFKYVNFFYQLIMYYFLCNSLCTLTVFTVLQRRPLLGQFLHPKIRFYGGKMHVPNLVLAWPTGWWRIPRQ